MPVVFFAFVAHHNLPPLYRELRFVPDSRGSDNATSSHPSYNATLPCARTTTPGSTNGSNRKWKRKRDKMMAAVRVSLAGCALVYTCTALAGYQLFRSWIDADVLQNFRAAQYPFIPFVKAAYCLVLLFSFPVMR